jgi:hypothetical protein
VFAGDLVFLLTRSVLAVTFPVFEIKLYKHQRQQNPATSSAEAPLRFT